MTRSTPGPVRALLTVLALVALAGCGEDTGPETALTEIVPPSWFTAAHDTAEPDADPPKWTRRYAKLPKSPSDVEMAYAQALDRAGWRYQAGACASAPEGGDITTDCWTHDGLVLAYVATPMTSGDETGPSRLDIVLHRVAAPSRALILTCPLNQPACRPGALTGAARG
jgi:hypothetical protein